MTTRSRITDFLNKQLTKVAEKDFEAGKVYAVELEHQGQTLRGHRLLQEGLTMTND